MISRVQIIATVAFLAMISLSLPTAARAGDIVGPPLPLADLGWIYSGVGFTANVNSDLTSFTFQNQGQTDVVELVNPSGTVLDSVSIPSGTVSDTVSVNWSLTAGNQYYLLQSTESNGLYSVWNLPAPSDTEISMTDTGIFSYFPDSASFGIRGTLYWADFNNIITTSQNSNAAEPTSVVLLGLNLLGAAAIGIAWKLRRSSTSSSCLEANPA